MPRVLRDKNRELVVFKPASGKSYILYKSKLNETLDPFFIHCLNVWVKSKEQEKGQCLLSD